MSNKSTGWGICLHCHWMRLFVSGEFGGVWLLVWQAIVLAGERFGECGIWFLSGRCVHTHEESIHKYSSLSIGKLNTWRKMVLVRGIPQATAAAPAFSVVRTGGGASARDVRRIAR